MEKLWPRCPVSHWWGSWSRGRSSLGFDTPEWCFLWSTQNRRYEKIKQLQEIKDRQELVSLEVMTSEVMLGKPPVCVYGRNIIDLNGQCFLHVSLVIQSKGFWFLFSTMMLRVLPQIYWPFSGCCQPGWRKASQIAASVYGTLHDSTLVGLHVFLLASLVKTQTLFMVRYLTLYNLFWANWATGKCWNTPIKSSFPPYLQKHQRMRVMDVWQCVCACVYIHTSSSTMDLFCADQL